MPVDCDGYNLKICTPSPTNIAPSSSRSKLNLQLSLQEIVVICVEVINIPSVISKITNYRAVVPVLDTITFVPCLLIEIYFKLSIVEDNISTFPHLYQYEGDSYAIIIGLIVVDISPLIYWSAVQPATTKYPLTALQSI
ncbi:hypothetical protein FGO68_gene5594 [Halteria grandinella]|uniref:Uncharacterized protein n=1 Tax=Halteria grandinella TaxID=5974 RepID=A0A8J8P6S9_HALGN|nr:hypothetical protein FGO68_gene5594 [Halteria grandinella]